MSPTSTYPGLRRTDQMIILGLVILQFLFLGGPLWERFAAWDHAIGWSYASIPALVLVGLALRRRLHWLPWLLHSLEIAAVKFALTAGVLICVMVARGNAPPEAVPPGPTADAGPALITPTPRVMARDPNGGAIVGRLLGPGGRPADGWVWVAGVQGLLTAAPTTEPVHLTERSDGLSPAFAVAEAGEPILVRSTDGRLHTARVLEGTHWLFNIPVPAEGQSPERWIAEPGNAEIGCTVHGRAERPAHLLVLGHPFFAHSKADGAFEIADIPPGAWELRARGEDGTDWEALPMTILAGSVARIEMRR